LMLSKTGPLWVAALAPVVLGEPTRKGTWLSVAAALLGCALLLRPTLAVGNVAGAAVLTGAFFSALAHMVLRRVSASDASMTIVFWYCSILALVTTPFAFAFGMRPTPLEWIYMSVVAVAATAGQVLMTHAYTVEEAPIVSASGYSNIVFGVLFGFLFWGEVPAIESWIGGGLIVASGLSLVVLSSRVPRHYRGPYRGEEPSDAGTLAPDRATS
ncbi:MAG: EamA family transporter, partial [Myxococcota bacterium]